MAEQVLIRGRPPRSTTVALLKAEGLPFSDLTDKHLEHFFYIGSDGSPTGLVGLEILGIDALLRSLVVGEHARRTGMGSALVEHAEHYAISTGVRSLYLLTTTAEAFFKRLGYERIDRSHAPLSIRRTTEFSTLCPTNSAFMVKRFKPLG